MTTQQTLVDLKNQKYLTFEMLQKSGILNTNKIAEQVLIFTKNPRQIIWHIENNTSNSPACNCGNALTWNTDTRSYKKYCSKRCTAKFSVAEKKQKNMRLLGVEWHSQTAEWKEKTASTSMLKYGADHYSKTNEFKNQVVETNRHTFGVDYPAQNVEVLKKMQATCKKNHNVVNPGQSRTIQEKIKSTNTKRYGTPCVFSANHIKEKIQQTNMNLYGSTHPMQNPLVAAQASLTAKQHYYCQSVLDKLNDCEWLEQQNKSGLTVGEIAQNLGVSSSNLCKYFHRHGIDIQRNNINTSVGEKQIVNFLNELQINNIIKNDRKILQGQELDIFLPDYRIAIEFHGLYWHTEMRGKHKKYHYNKSTMCSEQDIQLLQILDTEWNNSRQQSIWKSMIRSRLQLNQRIYARNCTIADLDTSTARQFFDQNHLNGFCGGAIKKGLFYKNKLVSAVILSKPRFNKKVKYELIRAATQQGITVVGGLSRLLSGIDGSIVSYADLRYATGKSYQAIGFEKQPEVSINYFYTKDYQTMYTRNQFQKHKLKSLLPVFDKQLTEVENMQANGYDRFWDAGQLSFIRG